MLKMSNHILFILLFVASSFVNAKEKKPPVAPQTMPSAPNVDPEEKKDAQLDLLRPLNKWYSLEGNYTGDLFQNFNGGLKKGSAYLSLLSLRGTFDLENAIGWKSTSVFLHLQGEQGRDPSTFIGDSQVTSNIETPVDTGRVYEAWIQKSFEDGKFTALLGLYDLNSEFYATAPAGLFLNSSFGIGKDLSQTGQNGPSIFPVTSLGLRLKAQPTNEFYLQSVVLDASSGDPKNPYGTHITLDVQDGYLIVNEIGWTPTRSRDGKESNVGKWALGTWFYTHTVDHMTLIDGSGDPIQTTNAGTYMIADYSINPVFSVFARYGQANESANFIKSNTSLGIYGKGFFANREEDEVGFAYTEIQISKYYKDLLNAASVDFENAESVFELTYKVAINDHFSLQPDLQYVIHPSADSNVKDSLSGTLRLKLSF